MRNNSSADARGVLLEHLAGGLVKATGAEDLLPFT
jgi:hypothetical protein